MGKRRYQITSSAKKKPLAHHHFSLGPEAHFLRLALANSIRALPYSFAYYDPYTNTIPSPANSILASSSRLLTTVGKRKHQQSSPEPKTPVLENVSQDSGIVCSPSGSVSTASMAMTIEEISPEYDNNSISIAEDEESWHTAMDVDEETTTSSETTLRKSMSLMSRSSSSASHILDRKRSSLPSRAAMAGGCKKIPIPRRYIRWKRSPSCLSAMSKQFSPGQTCNSNGNSEARYSSHHHLRHSCCQAGHSTTANGDTLNNRSTESTRAARRTFSRAFKRGSAILSKISEIVFPSSFRQYMPVTTDKQQDREEEDKAAWQKYTPLPSPLPVPAKMARLGVDSDCRTRLLAQQRTQGMRNGRADDEVDGNRNSEESLQVQRVCGTRGVREFKRTQKSFLVV